MSRPIPTSILVGFLGAGKTTLINHLLIHTGGQKIAVIVNEFGEVNVDAKLVRHTTERMIELTNGCICCTLRGDLLDELRDLSQHPLDYILIESTGIGEPLPIAQTFHMQDLPELVRLDSIITVVDAASFWDMYHAEGEVEVEAETGETQVQPLAPLLIDQVEFTNLILINKADVASEADLVTLTAFLRQVNPDARIYRTVRGVIEAEKLINTGLYDYAKATEAEDWEAEWNQPSSEVEEYGFGSFVYRAERPLRWQSFVQFMNEGWPAVSLRAKGFVAFADHAPIILQQAGALIEVEELAAAEGATTDADLSTELVFIGRGLERAEIAAALEACLAE